MAAAPAQAQVPAEARGPERVERRGTPLDDRDDFRERALRAQAAADVAATPKTPANAFVRLGAGLTGVDGGSSDWGDYDGDGDLDLVVTGQDAGFNETAAIYRNDGGGTFTPLDAGLTGVKDGSSAWGDYDADGDLDLVVTGSDGSNRTATIYENQSIQ
jgi:hypothetical protein